MRCVLPWLDRWAAKKPDAAAFEGEKTCLTWRQLHDTAAPASRSRCAVHGQKPDDCRGDARRAGGRVLLYHH